MAFAIQIAVDGTLTTVALTTATNGSVLLAKNLARKGGVVFNDSSGSLYISLCSTATVPTTAVFTALLATNTYYQVPSNYVGVIQGISAAGVTGNARVTELT